MTKNKVGDVDGYVMVVKKKNLKAYRQMAQTGFKVWSKYGALDYKECVGDDLKVKFGSSFSRLVKLKPGEVVVFSYIGYKSRAQRDQVNAKVMKDPTMNDPKWKDKPIPFDMKRMTYGGFKVLVG